MTGPDEWVVTYRITHSGGFALFEMYRGTKAECERIAAHSAAPDMFEDKKVEQFKAIVGPAKDWEDFLEEASDNSDKH